MYRTIRMILRYDTIHTICTLYRTIHEHLRYANTIKNFLHRIRYVSYDTDNYDVTFLLFPFSFDKHQSKALRKEINYYHIHILNDGKMNY